MNSLQDLIKEKEYTFQEYLARVFTLVLAGLGISFVVAYAMAYLGGYRLLVRLPAPIMLIFIVQIGVAWLFGSRLFEMKKSTAWACYIIYCVTLGLTYSVLPFVYDGRSILFAIAMTVALFAALAIIGHTTHVDLSKYSSYMMIGLLMILVITFINFFFVHSQAMDLMVSYIGVILFLGITAYDVQRLRNMYLQGYSDKNLFDKLMIYGAFQLYLDFVNIFIRLLQIFGGRRRR